MKHWSLVLSFATAALLSACSSVDRLADCQSICDRYEECSDESYDVSECRSDCTDKAKNDADFDNKVDRCDVCIDDRSCSGAAFNCATECVGIVP